MKCDGPQILAPGFADLDALECTVSLPSSVNDAHGTGRSQESNEVMMCLMCLAQCLNCVSLSKGSQSLHTHPPHVVTDGKSIWPSILPSGEKCTLSL